MNNIIACCLIVLPLTNLHVTSSFGYRKHPVTGHYAYHNGVDLRAHGDTVFAITSGTVSSTGFDNLLGLNIRLHHLHFSSVYGHLSQVFVAPGEVLDAGQAIGITGKTGRTTAEHLHLSIQINQGHTAPLKFIYQELINTKTHG